MPSFSALFKGLTLLTVVALIGGGLFIYSGIYPIGADTPHNSVTYWALETLRERSVTRAAKNIEVPNDLDSSDRLLAGGPDYNDMCVGCHLQPGKLESDFTIGLYPAPPNLSLPEDEHTHSHGPSDSNTNAIKRQFWIIKHGIKASGMPAWGPTHSDERIWNMVAFVQQLPTLSKNQYQILTARGDVEGTHEH